MAAAPNYYIDQSLAPQVTVTGGVSATNDLFLTSGTVTISGNIYDAANSNGIGGLMFQLESDNLFAVGFTDTNGNYQYVFNNPPGFAGSMTIWAAHPLVVDTFTLPVVLAAPAGALVGEML